MAGNGADDRKLRWVLVAAAVVLVVAVATYLVKGVNTTSRPKIETNGARSSRVEGFPQIGFTVRPARGPSRHYCALLATTVAQQDRGLMNRKDLAGYDAMVFQFVDPTTVEFYMKDTLIPLSIAWFDASGNFVSATDMTPCLTETNCRLYGASAPYTVAIEVAQGQLGHLGAGPGSTLTVGGAC